MHQPSSLDHDADITQGCETRECEHNKKKAKKRFTDLYKRGSGQYNEVAIHVVYGKHATDWEPHVTKFMETNAILSVVNEKTLQFVCDSQKRAKWEDGEKIRNIFITYEDKPSREEKKRLGPGPAPLVFIRRDSTGSLKIVFFKTAVDKGEQLNLSEELEYSLGMQGVIDGKCYYKSGWGSISGQKKWIQFRRYCIYVYGSQVKGWSHRGSGPPDDRPIDTTHAASASRLDKHRRNRFYWLPAPLPEGFAESLPPLPHLPDFLVPVDSGKGVTAPFSGQTRKVPTDPAPECRLQLSGAKVLQEGTRVHISGGTMLYFWDLGSDVTPRYQYETLPGSLQFDAGSEVQASSWVCCPTPRPRIPSPHRLSPSWQEGQPPAHRPHVVLSCERGAALPLFPSILE